MQIKLTESEVNTLQRYLKLDLINARGAIAIGIGNDTFVKDLESIIKKIGGMQIELTESEVNILQRYLKLDLINARGAIAVGIGNDTFVKDLESIIKKIGGADD